MYRKFKIGFVCKIIEISDLHAPSRSALSTKLEGLFFVTSAALCPATGSLEEVFFSGLLDSDFDFSFFSFFFLLFSFTRVIPFFTLFFVL